MSTCLALAWTVVGRADLQYMPLIHTELTSAEPAWALRPYESLIGPQQGYVKGPRPEDDKTNLYMIQGLFLNEGPVEELETTGPMQPRPSLLAQRQRCKKAWAPRTRRPMLELLLIIPLGL